MKTKRKFYNFLWRQERKKDHIKRNEASYRFEVLSSNTSSNNKSTPSKVWKQITHYLECYTKSKPSIQCEVRINVILNLFFYWRIIALQNFVFCKTSTWISHRYTYIPSFLNLPPSSLPSHPYRLIQSSCFSFLHHTANSCWLSILHMVM